MNKVSTAVRATHLPTKISVFVQKTRSQLENKKLSIKRLEEKVLAGNILKLEKQMQETWHNQGEIQRGDPVKTFSGMDFRENNTDQSFKTKIVRLKNDLKKHRNELN